MSHFHNNMLLGSAGNQGAYEIERSLRFNDDDDAFLERTPSSAGNRKTWTWSAWLKRCTLGNDQQFFTAAPSGHASDTAITFLSFDPNDRLYFYSNWSSATRHFVQPSQVFRDVSAWYHIVLSVDTTDATASERVKIYINGQRVTDFATENQPAQDLEPYVNAAVEHKLGEEAVRDRYNFDGYMTEMHLVDGTALAASDFGETDTETGAWIPKEYTGSYGTNGFYLDFSDNSSVSALGTDGSGNGNNWTPTNFDVGSAPDTDSVEDTPTNNWCTLNPLARFGGNEPTNGNLKFNSVGGGDGSLLGTHVLEAGKKYYWEFEYTETGSGSQCPVGITSQFYADQFVKGGSTTGMFAFDFRGSAGTPQAKDEGSTTNYGTRPSSGTMCGIALDLSTGKLYAHKGNTYYNSGDPAAGSGAVVTGIPTNQDFLLHVSVDAGGGGNESTLEFNFGQQGFTYTAPTDFEALNTANLSVPDIEDGTDYFTPVLYTGNLTARNITVADSQDNSWQPDWVWIKGRPTTSSHTLYDSVRGATKVLSSHNNNSESTDADTLTQFRSDGFSLGADLKVNTNGDTYASWNWKAGGNSNTFNVDGTGYATAAAAGLDGGTLTPTGASVNTTSGFSIIAYTGDGNDPGSSTVTCSHGLGASPAMIITKKRSSGGTDYNWSTWHQELGSGYGIWLNLNNARNPAMWNGDSNHSSTLFSPADRDYNNVLNETYINYVFAEVAGFSKFGSYQGNGLTNGPFINCGFSVAYLMVKKYTSTENWAIYDDKRDTYNPREKEIFADSGLGEYDGNRYIDFLSNGFKPKANSGTSNLSGQSYIFMAFAKNPFKYANAV
jgi:hypothetical protein